MRPFVCYSATNLHGYIAGPAREIEWSFTEPGDQKQESLHAGLF
jgi:hypothetical protein